MGGPASLEWLGRSRYVRHSCGRGYHQVEKKRAAWLLLIGLLVATCNESSAGVLAVRDKRGNSNPSASTTGSAELLGNVSSHEATVGGVQRPRITRSMSREYAQRQGMPHQQMGEVATLTGNGAAERMSLSSPAEQHHDKGQTTTPTTQTAHASVAPLPSFVFPRKRGSSVVGKQEEPKRPKLRSSRVLSEGEIPESDEETPEPADKTPGPAGKTPEPVVRTPVQVGLARSTSILSEGEIPDSDVETDVQAPEVGRQPQETIQQAEDTPEDETNALATASDGDQFIVVDIQQTRLPNFQLHRVYSRKGALTGAPYLYIRAERELDLALASIERIPEPASGHRRIVVIVASFLRIGSVLRYFEEHINTKLPDAVFFKRMARSELDNVKKHSGRGGLAAGFDPGRYDQYFVRPWIKASFHVEGKLISRHFDENLIRINLPRMTKFKDSLDSVTRSPFRGEFTLRRDRENTYVIRQDLLEPDLTSQTEGTEAFLQKHGIKVSDNIRLSGNGKITVECGETGIRMHPQDLQKKMEVVFDQLPVLTPFDPSVFPAKDRTIIVDLESETRPEHGTAHVAAYGSKSIFVKRCSATHLRSCVELFPTKLLPRQDDVYIKATGADGMRSLTNMLREAKKLNWSDTLEIFKYALIKAAPDEASLDYENDVGEKQNVTARMTFWPYFHELRAGFIKVLGTVCDEDVVLTFLKRQFQLTLETGEHFFGGFELGKAVITFKFDRIVVESSATKFGTGFLKSSAKEEFMYPSSTRMLLKGRAGYNLRKFSKFEGLTILCGNALMDINEFIDDELVIEQIRVKAKYNHSGLKLPDAFSSTLLDKPSLPESSTSQLFVPL